MSNFVQEFGNAAQATETETAYIDFAAGNFLVVAACIWDPYTGYGDLLDLTIEGDGGGWILLFSGSASGEMHRVWYKYAAGGESLIKVKGIWKPDRPPVLPMVAFSGVELTSIQPTSPIDRSSSRSYRSNAPDSNPTAQSSSPDNLVLGTFTRIGYYDVTESNWRFDATLGSQVDLDERYVEGFIDPDVVDSGARISYGTIAGYNTERYKIDLSYAKNVLIGCVIIRTIAPTIIEPYPFYLNEYVKTPSVELSVGVATEIITVQSATVVFVVDTPALPLTETIRVPSIRMDAAVQTLALAVLQADVAIPPIIVNTGVIALTESVKGVSHELILVAVAETITVRSATIILGMAVAAETITVLSASMTIGVIRVVETFTVYPATPQLALIVYVNSFTLATVAVRQATYTLGLVPVQETIVVCEATIVLGAATISMGVVALVAQLRPVDRLTDVPVMSLGIVTPLALLSARETLDIGYVALVFTPLSLFSARRTLDISFVALPISIPSASLIAPIGVVGLTEVVLPIGHILTFLPAQLVLTLIPPSRTLSIGVAQLALMVRPSRQYYHLKEALWSDMTITDSETRVNMET